MRVMVACASKHGSTEGIASAIEKRLHELGHDATAVRVSDGGTVLSLVTLRLRDVGK